MNEYRSFPKKDFRNLPVSVVHNNRNKLIYSSQKLNWDPGIILRHGSEPKWLHIHQNLFENTQARPPTQSKNVQTSQNLFFEKSVFPINAKSQWDFLTNRALELMYQGEKMQNQKLIW